MVRWILEVEVAIVNACTGASYTFFDFGVPADYPVQRPTIGNAPTRKSMQYQYRGGIQGVTPFASDYSAESAEYRPNGAIKHSYEQARQQDIENLPQWARERYTTSTSGSFGGGGILAAMMQSTMDTAAGATQARQRNMTSNVF